MFVHFYFFIVFWFHSKRSFCSNRFDREMDRVSERLSKRESCDKKMRKRTQKNKIFNDLIFFFRWMSLKRNQHISTKNLNFDFTISSCCRFSNRTNQEETNQMGKRSKSCKTPPRKRESNLMNFFIIRRLESQINVRFETCLCAKIKSSIKRCYPCNVWSFELKNSRHFLTHCSEGAWPKETQTLEIGHVCCDDTFAIMFMCDC